MALPWFHMMHSNMWWGLCFELTFSILQTAVQDTLNEAEGSQPVFHPRQNSFEGSDDEDDGPNDNAVTQNQVSSNTGTAAVTTGIPTVTTVAQRPNQVHEHVV